MPLLNEDDVRHMRSVRVECQCGAVIHQNYCRQCDEFYYYGHTAKCHLAGAPGSALDHVGHRLYPIGPPQCTEKPVQNVNLDGLLFGWKNEQPVELQMPESPHRYLPCFTSADGLRSFFDRFAPLFLFDRIKQISDGHEFLSSVPSEIIIIIDPHVTATGSVRFVQLLRN